MTEFKSVCESRSVCADLCEGICLGSMCNPVTKKDKDTMCVFSRKETLNSKTYIKLPIPLTNVNKDI